MIRVGPDERDVRTVDLPPGPRRTLVARQDAEITVAEALVNQRLDNQAAPSEVRAAFLRLKEARAKRQSLLDCPFYQIAQEAADHAS